MKCRFEQEIVADHGLVYSSLRIGGDYGERIADTCAASCDGDRMGGEWWADRIAMALNYFRGMDNEELAHALMRKQDEQEGEEE